MFHIFPHWNITYLYGIYLHVLYEGACSATQNEFRLVKYLLDPNRYDTNVLPTDDPDEPVLVKVGLALNQIIDLVSSNIFLSLINLKLLIARLRGKKSP